MLEIVRGKNSSKEVIALRAVDIDTIYLNGYGFPAYQSGPIWHADTVGLQKVYQRICEFKQASTENSGNRLLCCGAWRKPERHLQISIRSRSRRRRRYWGRYERSSHRSQFAHRAGQVISRVVQPDAPRR